MNNRRSEDTFFGGYKRQSLLAEFSGKATNDELGTSCNKLREEVLWLLDRWETTHDLLIMEQENTNRWQNLYYELQLKCIKLEDRIKSQ